MERLRAPELEPARAWLGTTRPLRLRELRGHVVVLDFWTSCCVNCMHVLPVLRDLERRYAGKPVLVIGVHSAKFPAEAAPERVADAIARHDVAHPVVVDDGLAIWERYAIRSWPTLVVLRPDGTIAAVAPGEPDPAALDTLVRGLLAEGEAHGTLAREPLTIPRGEPPPPRPLAFPGKVAVAGDGRIAVADAGHHRVLVLSPAGDVLVSIGSGRRGHRDGPFADARLDDPQGLAWADDGALWICDARNHTVARADLSHARLDTVAGTGFMGHVPIASPSPARATALRSPWDLVLVEDRVLVCLAGSHQLGVLAPAGGGGWTIGMLAGDGREALVDGPPRVACFAQPSGFARAGDRVWIADSETSAIRELDLATGDTRTLVGAGLFDWGAEDGPFAAARLQHPLAVAVTADGDLVVADTFNDRLRRLDRRAGLVSTLSLGTDRESLREPGGLAVLPDGDLLVADTGHHRLVRLAADGRFKAELEVRGAPPVPAPTDEPPPPLAAAPATRWFDLVLERAPALAPGRATGRLRLVAPAGWKFNDGAPQRLALEVSRRSDLVTTADRITLSGQDRSDMFVEIDLEVAELPTSEVRSELLVRVDAVLCGGDPEVCAPSQAWLRIPLLLTNAGEAAFAVDLALASPV
ncbi:Thiol-disulfide isomerase or thioredoxin [Nannocystis exedens]|uniref:Thiol-disulfide isomerase or thioredoxin n=1 Tax=Nannocystis exedens TaxID=54 RepID=A0A1I2B025_9BACT|nr:thioredoxin-like domain-containing protein [Nannocystis exedens]PCC74381.1 Thiol-disulfide oxidoreductase YkuV [Nannocystis exedens]SFE49357.1 Thiol-disulfide isomerase or thioredoxin [Nannocystis exedens]